MRQRLQHPSLKVKTVYVVMHQPAHQNKLFVSTSLFYQCTIFLVQHVGKSAYLNLDSAIIYRLTDSILTPVQADYLRCEYHCFAPVDSKEIKVRYLVPRVWNVAVRV